MDTETPTILSDPEHGQFKSESFREKTFTLERTNCYGNALSSKRPLNSHRTTRHPKTISKCYPFGMRSTKALHPTVPLNSVIAGMSSRKTIVTALSRRNRINYLRSSDSQRIFSLSSQTRDISLACKTFIYRLQSSGGANSALRTGLRHILSQRGRERQ